MTPLNKKHYSIGDVSQLLDVPISTLLYWESKFPMLNPNRSPKGTRRFTEADVNTVEYIRDLVWEKGLKIDAAIEFMNRNFRLSPPRVMRKCDSPQAAVALLEEVAETMEDKHAAAKIQAAINYLQSLTGKIR